MKKNHFLGNMLLCTAFSFPLTVSAQENYIKVYSGRQNRTILYRFKDAVSEMGSTIGLQVHRSFWVRKEMIHTFKKQQGRGEITTKSGLAIPVSRTYVKAVEQHC